MPKFKPKKTEVSINTIIDELVKIAFTNPDDLFTWGEIQILTPFGPQTINKIFLKPGKEIDRDIKSAIAGISETANGGLNLKLHDKIKALESLKRFVGADNLKEIEKAVKIKRAELLDTKREGTKIIFNYAVIDEDQKN